MLDRGRAVHLWGDGIDDPDRRFELELVLRAQRLRGELGAAHR
jgi:hypothetical protein